MTKFNENILKSINMKVQFLCPALHLYLIDIYKKFSEDILKVFKSESGHDFVTDA